VTEGDKKRMHVFLKNEDLRVLYLQKHKQKQLPRIDDRADSYRFPVISRNEKPPLTKKYKKAISRRYKRKLIFFVSM
jgi:hypothetical protein